MDDQRYMFGVKAQRLAMCMQFITGHYAFMFL